MLPVFVFAHTLEQLIDLAYENNLVHSSTMSVEALKDEYKSVQNGYLPSLSVGGSYVQTNKETQSVPDSGYQGYAKIHYVLYDGGKKYDVYKSYDASLKSSEKSLDALKNDLAKTVTTLYFDYLAKVEAKAAKQKQVEQLQAQMQRLQSFFDNGMTTEDEVQKIIAQTQAVTVDLHQIELEIETIMHNLRYLTKNDVFITQGSKLVVNDFATQANRFDLQAFAYDLQALKATADAQKSAYLPTLFLENRYNVYDYDYNSNLYANPVEQNIFSLNLEWKIFDFFQTKRGYDSKFKTYLSQKYRYDYETQKAQTDLALAKRAVKIAKLKINASKQALDAANATYDVVKSKFENGLVDNVAFLDALTQKYDAQSAYTAATYELEKKKAEVLYQGGENIKDYVQ